MKNLRKVILLILVFTMIFCLCCGFTYSPQNKSRGIIIDYFPSISLCEPGNYFTMGCSIISSNVDVPGFTVDYKWYMCDDFNKTNSILVNSQGDSWLVYFNYERTDLYFYCVVTDMIDGSTATSPVSLFTKDPSHLVVPTPSPVPSPSPSVSPSPSISPSPSVTPSPSASPSPSISPSPTEKPTPKPTPSNIPIVAIVIGCVVVLVVLGFVIKKIKK